jgi:hypothetical protein
MKNLSQVTEITPLIRKSFYGKALAIREGETTSLKSYNTKVAEYNHKTNKMTVNGWYSATTARHINAFLALFGFNICNKKQLENYNNL